MPSKQQEVVPAKVADGGWGWVCVAACAFNLALYRGIAMSFSILYEAMRVKYNSTATATAWVYSICGMVMFFTSVFVSPLCKKVGCRAVSMAGGVMYGLGMVLTAFSTDIRHIYVTYGVFVGLANCTIVVTSSLVVNQYFNKHRAKAMSLNTMGVSVGTVVFTNLMSEVLERFSLTVCFIILGCISLHQVLASAMFRPPKIARNNRDVSLNESNLKQKFETINEEDKADFGNQPDLEPAHDSGVDEHVENEGTGENHEVTVEPQTKSLEDHGTDEESKTQQLKQCCLYYCDVDLLKDPRFLGMFFMTVCFSISVFMVDTSLAGWSAERGVSIRQVSWVISLGTIVEVIVRLITGFLFDAKKIRPIRVYVYGGLTLCATAFLVLFPLAYDFPTIMVLFIPFRGFTCIYYTHSSVILADIATPAKMYGALGMLQFGRGISSVVGPVMAGFIKDVQGSYDSAFYVGGALATCSILLYLVLLEFTRRKKKKTDILSR